MVTCICVGMAWPFSVPGEYLHWRNASFADSCNIEGPEMIFIPVTLPVASIVVSTTTSPSTRLRRASEGYAGLVEETRRGACTRPPTGTGACTCEEGEPRFVPGTMPPIAAMLGAPLPIEGGAMGSLFEAAGRRAGTTADVKFEGSFGLPEFAADAFAGVGFKG
jgi:hypothetical protein